MNTLTNYFNGKPVLITGASGFVGSNISRAFLNSGAVTIGLLRPVSDSRRLEGLVPNLRIYRADLNDLNSLSEVFRKEKPEHIVHCAAPLHVNLTSPDQLENFQMLAHQQLENIFQATALLQNPLRNFTHICSSTVYEWEPERFILSEKTPLKPATLRGQLKLGQFRSCRSLCEKNRIPLRVARIFRAFGPWDFTNRFILRAIAAGFGREDIALGQDQFKRDYIHVDDISEAVLRMTADSSNDSMTFNIGSGRDYSPTEIIGILESILGKPIPKSEKAFSRNRMDRGRYVADISHARLKLGWKPRHDIISGLSQTVDWYKSYHNLK